MRQVFFEAGRRRSGLARGSLSLPMMRCGNQALAEAVAQIAAGETPETLHGKNIAMLRRFFWRALDRVIPDGPPVFLMWVIVTLLMINATIALSR
jgi:hypothetical protein